MDYLVYLDYLFPFGFIRTVSALTQTNIYDKRSPFITIIDHLKLLFRTVYDLLIIKNLNSQLRSEANSYQAISNPTTKVW